jgi:hypothetical protein
MDSSVRQSQRQWYGIVCRQGFQYFKVMFLDVTAPGAIAPGIADVQ